MLRQCLPLCAARNAVSTTTLIVAAVAWIGLAGWPTCSEKSRGSDSCSTAFSFKVEVKTYCPYPIHCESGIFFVAICQKVMRLSKSIFCHLGRRKRKSLVKSIDTFLMVLAILFFVFPLFTESFPYREERVYNSLYGIKVSCGSCRLAFYPVL